ncbi:hypothetical protein D3C77_636280 [compost metagenome]
MTITPPMTRMPRLRSNVVSRSAASPVASSTGQVPNPNASINSALSSASPWLADQSNVL